MGTAGPTRKKRPYLNVLSSSMGEAGSDTGSNVGHVAEIGAFVGYFLGQAEPAWLVRRLAAPATSATGFPFLFGIAAYV